MKSRLMEAFILLTATGLTFATIMHPGPAVAEPTVKITISGVGAQQGALMIALYDEKAWAGKPIAARNLAVAGDTATVLLAAPAPGSYGIKIYHDVDGNGVLGKNVMGLPTEPFGFSNNAPADFGPPEFVDAAFNIGPDGAAQTITLR